MKRLLEQFDVVHAIPTQDIDTADITSAYVEVGQYRHGYAVITTEALGAGKTATLQLMQKDGASGTPKVLGSAVTVTHPAQSGEVAFNVDDLDIANGYDRVAVVAGSDAGATKFGAVLLFLGGKRFS